MDHCGTLAAVARNGATSTTRRHVSGEVEHDAWRPSSEAGISAAPLEHTASATASRPSALVTLNHASSGLNAQVMRVTDGDPVTIVGRSTLVVR